MTLQPRPRVHSSTFKTTRFAHPTGTPAKADGPGYHDERNRMKHWTTEQLKAYSITSGGRVDDPHPLLKAKHYRLLLLGTARRLASNKYNRH